MDLGLELHEQHGVPVVAVSGEIDFGGAPRVRDALVKRAMAGDRVVVADLSAVDLLDSTGLGVLVAALKRFRTMGGDLRLVVRGDRVRSVFEITGLDKAFAIFDTLDDAVGAAPTGRG